MIRNSSSRSRATIRAAGKPAIKVFFFLALASLAAATASASGRFSASSMEGVGIKQEGKIVISNDAKAITVYQFHGDIRRALLSLKSTPSLSHNPYGSVVYESGVDVERGVPVELRAIVREAAAAHGVDPRLIAAVARQESSFNSRAVSPVGAQGLMQLMPQTAAFLGVRNAFDPRENIFGGTRYLRMLLDTFRGDLDLTLAAYNAGPGAVQKYRGVPPYRETRNYVAKVRGSYEASLRNGL